MPSAARPTRPRIQPSRQRHQRGRRRSACGGPANLPSAPRDQVRCPCPARPRSTATSPGRHGAHWHVRLRGDCGADRPRGASAACAPTPSALRACARSSPSSPTCRSCRRSSGSWPLRPRTHPSADLRVRACMEGRGMKPRVHAHRPRWRSWSGNSPVALQSTDVHQVRPVGAGHGPGAMHAFRGSRRGYRARRVSAWLATTWATTACAP